MSNPAVPVAQAVLPTKPQTMSIVWVPGSNVQSEEDSNASLVCKASAYPEATGLVDIEVGQHAGVRVGSSLHPAHAYLTKVYF